MFSNIPTCSATVLIVDDDDAVRRSLKFMLELEGLRARTFPTGDALLAEQVLPRQGCLVLDQKMPTMTGLELVSRLRARRVCLPVVLITAGLTSEVAASAAQAQVSAVLEKPLQQDDIVHAIRDALERA